MKSLRSRFGNWRMLAMMTLAFPLPSAAGQGPNVTSAVVPDQAEKDRTPEGPLVGKWSYRSFRSDPDLSSDARSLLFATGTMELAASGSGRISGSLAGDGWRLRLAGTISGSDPTTIQFQGRGVMGNEEWVYDYRGYAVPKWANGVDQRAAIVGSIVRTVPHSGGKATAGYVAQWIAVRQDASNPQTADLERAGRADTAAGDVVNLRHGLAARLLEESIAELRRQATQTFDADAARLAPQRLALSRAAVARRRRRRGDA